MPPPSAGHGVYEALDMGLLGPCHFWLAYVSDPSDSGKIHSAVRQRFEDGEADVVEGMQTFASITEQAKAALLEGDTAKFGLWSHI